MSDEGYMKRGKAQVLFNFLPGNTFDYTGTAGIHKVEKIDTIRRTDLDKEYIGQQVLNKIRAWRGNSLGAVGFPEYPSSFQLVEPQEVETSLFPLLFRCTTCERIHSYQDTRDLVQYNRSFNCKHDGCSGSIQQHQFVFVHECGEIRSPYPGQCDRCNSYDDWTFESYGSERFRNAEWRCKSCTNTKDIEAWCHCDLHNSRMQLAVHRASSVFQPHYVTVINIGSGAVSDASSPRFAKAVLARYLGLTSEPIDEVDLESRQVSEEREEKEWQLEQYMDMYERSKADEIATEIERLEAELADFDDGDDPIGDQAIDMVPFLDTEDRIEDHRHQAVYDVYQAIQADEELDRRTVREVVLEAGADSPKSQQERELRAERLEGKLSELGFSDVAFIEDFPMTNVVFGYTRINREPDDSRLVAFQEGEVESSGDGTPLFADTVQTEAVQFGLKPRRVFRWLLSNSQFDTDLQRSLRDAIVDSALPEGRKIPVSDDWDAATVDGWLATASPSPRDTEPLSNWSESHIRAWFVENVGHVPDFESMRVDSSGESNVSPITYFVYHLVHSYSHLVLKHVTQLSGMSRTSLAEFLMPRALSFVVYSNQRTDFNIGGLYTLVEARLKELLSEINDRGSDCVYDPVCSRGGSACHSCMYISEVSCTHLNRNLGRDFVYGSKTMADKNLNGYLNMEGDA